MGNSWLNGGNRLFGTIFGGLLGMALFSIYIQFYPEGGFHPLILPLLFVGVILLIIAPILIYNLYILQIRDADTLQARAIAQQTRDNGAHF